MFRVVCASAASHLYSNTELCSMLDETRRTNARHGITGMLLYKNGAFLQILEGEHEDVLNLVSTIREDPRHKRFCILLSETSEQRLFPDWSMSFPVSGDTSLTSTAGFSDLLNTPFTGNEFSSNPAHCMRLLLSFKKNM
jgi:Sensors of blue-light using FAD